MYVPSLCQQYLKKIYNKGWEWSSNNAVCCVGYTQKKETSAVNESVTLSCQYSNDIAQFKLYTVSHCVCVCTYIHTHKANIINFHHHSTLFTLHNYFHVVRGKKSGGGGGGKIGQKLGTIIWVNTVHFNMKEVTAINIHFVKFNECR
jgi:hypothetical protein